MANSREISAIKAFLLAPGIKGQARVNAFLDACEMLLALVREMNFGMSLKKMPDAEQVDAYYSNFFMPQLKTQLALTLTASQLNDSAAHVVSLAAAISDELSSGKLSLEQQNKLNGLANFLMRLADVVCKKIDDRDMYYQFQNDYRLLVQTYLNPGAKEKEKKEALDGFLFYFFSPKKEKLADAESERNRKVPRVDSSESDISSLHVEGSGTPRDDDADLEDEAGPPKNGPYRHSF